MKWRFVVLTSSCVVPEHTWCTDEAPHIFFTFTQMFRPVSFRFATHNTRSVSSCTFGMCCTRCNSCVYKWLCTSRARSIWERRCLLAVLYCSATSSAWWALCCSRQACATVSGWWVVASLSSNNRFKWTLQARCTVCGFGGLCVWLVSIPSAHACLGMNLSNSIVCDVCLFESYSIVSLLSILKKNKNKHNVHPPVVIINIDIDSVIEIGD